MDKNRFSLVNVFLILFLAASFLTRAALAVYAWPELEHGIPLLAKIFTVGLFFDILTFSYAALPLVFWTLLAPAGVYSSKWHRYAVRAVFFLSAYALAFNGTAEYLFFYEFGVRFNFIAVDYLVYTNEVWGNIRESYNLALILPALFVLSAGVLALAKKPLDRALAAAGPFRKRLLPAAVMLAVPVLGFAFVTLNWARISRNEYANELSSNGVYSFFSALRNNELPYDKFYASMDADAAFRLLRDDLKGSGVRFLGPELRNIKRKITASGPEKKLNLVLIVEESLSGEYLKALGGNKGVTPNLDSLAPKSLFFKKFYASGTRTVRGLEALNLSMPPLPGTSIIKRPDNGGFFSWGGLMRERGYDNKFIYAGYGYFDNMNSFFAGNGFDIVDRADFAKSEIAFANVWGVSDEDLLNRTITEADKSYKAGKRFFSLVMTTSNHRPFTYPEGRIDIPPSSQSRRGAIKYADYAIGKFLKDAKNRPWFRDTVFIITADHCANSADRTEMPVRNYHIPLLIYSPAHVKPGVSEVLAGQPDVAPTVLGLLNFSYESIFLGRDAMKGGPAAGRAFVSTYQKLGFLKGDFLAVLGPMKYVKTYRIEGRAETLSEGPETAGLKDEGIAFYQTANYLHKNRLNRLP
ncbi:MAG: sulfatase [Elusimicrobia bacterium GWA2_56_46]|nr:MAG: sulfatase [Elusimicrobia bacterium GWA2_56_46]OGR55773.1 MAG: sulfatase [Elusimicrobia bacterium GWC2_56_31]HBB66641.1 sulfatase [Elusimicrobiota bacterium]HBW23584.1 sulfatase [Elusimicrobiota bacterium]